MKTITRKSMLYQTDVEYGDWCMNHVEGCSHGCKYPCYAYLSKKRYGVVSGYEDWCEPKLVSNTLELLKKELTPKRIAKIKNVQLCFTTDPFMADYPEIYQVSLGAIAMLNSKDIPVTILTKGFLPTPMENVWEDDEPGLWISPFGYADPDDELPIAYMVGEDDYVTKEKLHPNNYYGISLVSLDEEFRKKWEPGSAPYADRIASLKALHDAGHKTWVSMEPYPDPHTSGWSLGVVGIEQRIEVALEELQKILKEVDFADRIVFGRWNYNKDIGSVSSLYESWDYYPRCAKQVQSFCKEHNIECIIKKGTVNSDD